MKSKYAESRDRFLQGLDKTKSTFNIDESSPEYGKLDAVASRYKNTGVESPFERLEKARALIEDAKAFYERETPELVEKESTDFMRLADASKVQEATDINRRGHKIMNTWGETLKRTLAKAGTSHEADEAENKESELIGSRWWRGRVMSLAMTIVPADDWLTQYYRVGKLEMLEGPGFNEGMPDYEIKKRLP